MKTIKHLPLLLLLIVSCSSKEEALTLADLKAGDKVEFIAIEMEEEHLADSSLHMRMLRAMGVSVGVTGTSRGSKEAQRGTLYGFDIEDGNYFGLYEPQASMVKVRRLK